MSCGRVMSSPLLEISSAYQWSLSLFLFCHLPDYIANVNIKTFSFDLGSQNPPLCSPVHRNRASSPLLSSSQKPHLCSPVHRNRPSALGFTEPAPLLLGSQNPPLCSPVHRTCPSALPLLSSSQNPPLCSPVHRTRASALGFTEPAPLLQVICVMCYANNINL